MMISAGGDVDAHVGDVEDRPVGQHQEVHDVPAQRARLAEDPVGQVAADARRAAGRARRPSCGAAEPAAERSTHDQHATSAITDSTTVYAVPVLNAAPGLRARSRTQQLADDVDAGRPVRWRAPAPW